MVSKQTKDRVFTTYRNKANDKTAHGLAIGDAMREVNEQEKQP